MDVKSENILKHIYDPLEECRGMWAERKELKGREKNYCCEGDRK